MIEEDSSDIGREKEVVIAEICVEPISSKVHPIESENRLSKVTEIITPAVSNNAADSSPTKAELPTTSCEHSEVVDTGNSNS